MDAALINLGPARRATLEALSNLTRKSGRIPSLTELANKRGLSVPGVKKHLDWLEQRRLVNKPKHVPRACVLTAAGKRALKLEPDSDRE
jgi:DNA-binding MarR family transcriptional regulator